MRQPHSKEIRGNHMNPIDMLQLGAKVQTFKEQHPRFPAFIKKVGKEAIKENAIVEVKVTSVEGQDYVTNLRLTAEDIEFLNMIFGGNAQ